MNPFNYDKNKMKLTTFEFSWVFVIVGVFTFLILNDYTGMAIVSLFFIALFYQISRNAFIRRLYKREKSQGAKE